MTTTPTHPDQAMLERWKPVVAAFNPRLPLSRLEIDPLYVTRPQAPHQRVLDDLLFEPEAHPVFVICGSHGSGRSTELACLDRHLHDQRALIEVDLDRALPEPVSTVSLLLVLGLAALKAAEAWTVDGQALAAAIRRLEAAVATLTPSENTPSIFPITELIEDVSAVTSISSPQKTSNHSAFGVHSHGQVIWHPQAGQLALNASDRARWAVLRAVNHAFRTLQDASGLPPVVLADDLDKLHHLDDLVRLLGEPKLLAALAVPLVLTGPVNLMHSDRFHDVRRHARLLPLYNLPVVTPSGEPDQDGIAMLMESVHRRQVHFQLPNLWIDEAALPLLVRGSGGCLRDFMGLLRAAALSAYNEGAATLKARNAEAAIRAWRHVLEFTLTEHAVQQLKAVLETRRPTDDALFDELLFNNIVVCYPEQNLWYRPHELLVDWLTNGP